MVFAYSKSQKRSVTEVTILNFTSKLNPLSETIVSLLARDGEGAEEWLPGYYREVRARYNIVPITDFLAKLIIEPSS